MRRWPTALSLAVLLAGTHGAAVSAQGRVAPAGALATARTHHTATLLADGRVLVAGGRAADGLSTLASTELFDPKTGRWTAGPPMTSPRSHHTATRLGDGRVLVAGGTSHESKGGENRFVALASAELFEPRAGRWMPVASLAEARNGHTATLLADGTVLVVGGAREQRGPLAAAERFDPETSAFARRRPLAGPRWLHEAVLLSDGSVVVLGGRGTGGDRRGTGVTLATVERYDPSSGVWHAVPSMSEARQRTGVVAAGDTVIVVGGQTVLSSTNYVESWRPGADAWRLAENNLSVAVVAHTVTLLPSGDLLVVGGEPPNAVDTGRVQVLRLATSRWCLAGELATPRKGHTATLLPDGRVLVVGGTSAGIPEPGAELWAPAPGPCEEPPGLPLSW